MIKSKALHLTVSTALLLSMAVVAGCGNTDGNGTQMHNAGNQGRVGVNNNTRGMTAGQHDLTNLKYSRQLSEKVSDISGVGPAHVFVTNRSAYVALSLNNQDTGTGLGTRAGNGLMGTNGARGNGLMGTRTNGTANNMGTQHQVPDHVRQEITTKIQKTAPHIKQVYITSDPDFYQHSARYANNNRLENTTGTLAHDFESWINRVFPMNANDADEYRAKGGLIHNDRDDGWFGGNRNGR
ncbi:YhcN/YlaJ family sporulation lipoprotein [Paenibacillus cisolokensis]|uniref:YhcN/YlaJ family sporulation lipoprotein n=1 Tax=Paenibacillus cisolokensis TaxID=1658519 RepID=UPI003D279677